MSTKRNNGPLWLVFALLILGVLISFIAHMIYVDGQTDEIRPEAIPVGDIDFLT